MRSYAPIRRWATDEKMKQGMSRKDAFSRGGVWSAAALNLQRKSFAQAAGNPFVETCWEGSALLAFRTLPQVPWLYGSRRAYLGRSVSAPIR